MGLAWFCSLPHGKEKRLFMATATVTSKGQITIPLDVRQRLNIQAGDRLEFVELTGGEFAIRPAVHDVRSLKGLLRKPAKPVSVDDMKAAVRLRGAGR
jgi:AbrB family looped-hinge helix DNA binding protein